MITYTGKYNSANIMIDDVEETAATQIRTFLDHPAFAKTYIAIMPDCHAGAGAVIGFTAKMNGYVIPNVVGVDIGCGVAVYPLDVVDINYELLDKFIKNNIPSGFNIRGISNTMVNGMKPFEGVTDDFQQEVTDIIPKIDTTEEKVFGSLGTLGGGNHFIEVAQGVDGRYWLLIHSGSRNFGLRIANYHQRKAKELIKQMFINPKEYSGLEYLPLELGGDEYLDDMKVAQRFASYNRTLMGDILVQVFFGHKVRGEFQTVHNYINFEDGIIRKGAVSAHEGERLVIPFNMRDGSAICIGRGNSKWNYSAPHGAGRVLARKEAKRTLSVDDFINDMDGIYTTTATQETIDESPRAYKNKETIVSAIEETVSIDFFLKPIYNFKATGD